MNDILFPKRKHPRLKYYDYSTPNCYFITICTFDRQCIFGNPGCLNQFGCIAKNGIDNIPNKYPNVCLDHYVVMPNHVHILIMVKEQKDSIEQIIGQYKAYVTKQIRKIQPNQKVWQVSFHDHIIRNQIGYEKIWNYIEGNPSKWEDDCFFCKAERNEK